MTEQARVVARNVRAPTGYDSNVLLAFGHVGDRAAVVADTVVVLPQQLAFARIVCTEAAIGARYEDQVTFGVQQ